MKVKICGMTKMDNILEVAELQPDYLGFIFYPPSPRYMRKALKPAQLRNLNTGAVITGVFVNSGYDEIIFLLEEYELQAVQLHGDESPEFCSEISRSGVEVIKAFRVNDNFDFNRLEEYQPFCKYFLFDTHSAQKGGSGKKFDWEILDKYLLEHPFFLSGGITANDALNIKNINHSALAGVDLNSRFEIKPGIKNISLLKHFIKELRERKS